MNTIGERIKTALSMRNINQSDLSKLTGISKASISAYALGEYIPKQNNIYLMAKALNVSEAWLMGFIDDYRRQDINADVHTINLPILGDVAAGLGVYAEENIIGDIDIPSSWMNKREEYFCLRVVGDSMYPIFIENDIVLIRKQKSIDSGSFAVVTIDGTDGVIKKVDYTKEDITLHSINPMYADRIFKGSEVTRIDVCGRVKRTIRNYIV